MGSGVKFIKYIFRQSTDFRPVLFPFLEIIRPPIFEPSGSPERKIRLLLSLAHFQLRIYLSQVWYNTIWLICLSDS